MHSALCYRMDGKRKQQGEEQEPYHPEAQVMMDCLFHRIFSFKQKNSKA